MRNDSSAFDRQGQGQGVGQRQQGPSQVHGQNQGHNRGQSSAAQPQGWQTRAQEVQPDNRVTDIRSWDGAAQREPDQKGKLLSDWQLVKRARFHAADRLERRNNASLITLSMVALYGGLFTVFALFFKDSLSAHIRAIFDWMAVVASWLTLTFTLTEQIKDYRGQARALHDCAQQVNNLRKQLQVTPITTPQQLNPYVQAYEGFIRNCAPNHSSLDYEVARYSGRSGVDGLSVSETAQRLRWLRLKSVLSTYAVYVLMSAAPLLAGLLAYALVSGAPVAAH